MEGGETGGEKVNWGWTLEVVRKMTLMLGEVEPVGWGGGQVP
jgi:hypothetical protein